jgi:hypothetical protein
MFFKHALPWQRKRRLQIQLCVLFAIRTGSQKGTQFIGSQLSLVEVGSNTFTVALRVVGGDKKGSLESKTVKYDHEPHGTRTQE